MDTQQIGRAALDVLSTAQAEMRRWERPLTHKAYAKGEVYVPQFDKPALTAALASLGALRDDERIHVSGTPPSVVDVPVSEVRAALTALLGEIDP